MRTATRLRVAEKPPPDPGSAHVATPELGDLVLIATLFILNLIPIAGELAGIGRWSAGIVGFAMGASLLVGCELWAELRALVQARRGSRGR